MLRHMIGIAKDVDLAGEPWRNHYAVPVGTDDEAALQLLVGSVRLARVERHPKGWAVYVWGRA